MVEFVLNSEVTEKNPHCVSIDTILRVRPIELATIKSDAYPNASLMIEHVLGSKDYAIRCRECAIPKSRKERVKVDLDDVPDILMSVSFSTHHSIHNTDDNRWYAEHILAVVQRNLSKLFNDAVDLPDLLCEYLSKAIQPA